MRDGVRFSPRRPGRESMTHALRGRRVAAAIAVMHAAAGRGILGRMKAHPDRLRDVVDAVIEALDEGLDGRALAARAMLSPYHFNRLVRAGIGEPPAAFRRRLLLERAAWRLGRGASVTDAGLEAGYDAIEAFSRAFTRAHRVPPSRFAEEPRDFRVAAPNGIHFHPPGGLLLPGQPRTTTMDLSDRLIEHEHWHTARLLEQAATLSDDVLDRHVRPGLVVHDFEGPEPDARTMLERIIFTKEVWTAAIGGREVPPRDKRSIAALKARLAAVQPQFAALVHRIRDRNEWDDAFVDALCTPPVSFTFGSVIAHILTVSVVRRQTVIDVLRELGVKGVETRDPIEWERLVEGRG
jgi:AraC family transcriptional regulator